MADGLHQNYNVRNPLWWQGVRSAKNMQPRLARPRSMKSQDPNHGHLY